MQEVRNEVEAVHHRVTAGNRKLTYVLRVKQDPDRARACGNGPRSSADRRPVDPPPVVSLNVFEGGHDITAFYEATFMLFASLEHARPIARGTLYATNHCPVLTGICVAGAAYLTKPAQAAYFIFPDLSVRHEGWYRIRFHLFEQTKRREDFDMDRVLISNLTAGAENLSSPNDQETMVNMTYVVSKPFQVFSAKKFPGLQISTEMSQTLSHQGCRVRIRRDVRQRRSEAKASKKDEDQRSLRAISTDRGASIELQDPFNRPAGMDTRRPSIDSQFSQGWVPTRHPSYAQSTMPSPHTVPAPGYYGQMNSYVAINHYEPVAPLVAEPEDMLNQGYSSPYVMPPPRSSYVQQQASTRPSPSQRSTSYKAISPAPLPSIQSMMNEDKTQPDQPARPHGGLYQIKSPRQQKRGHSRSSEDSYSRLKDGARPSQTPSGRTNKYSMGLPGLPNDGSRYPLAGGNDIIEADVDAEHEIDEHSDSGDSVLDGNFYRRANGTKTRVLPKYPPE